ncbi:MAG: EFR1 family ferrodoxin [Halobacteriota archaeon]|nr:EFR1 family ferrodoxin [Halobacteriota archaeon]
MQFETIDFYYFSGTGNTLLVVRKMAEVFEENGVNVNIYRIEKTDPSDINLNHVIGLGFPVAEQGTYPFVWDFVRSLPEADGFPIFMVDTLLAYSGGVVGPMKRIVKKKGYHPVGAKEILMPNNLFPRKIIAEKNEKKIHKGLEKAKKYANDILEGKSKWPRIPVLSDFLAIFSEQDLTWRFFRKYYRLSIDTSKCKRCKLCFKLCPVENIEMKEYPKLGKRCIFCMRCISFCPTKAIHRSKDKYQVYRAVKADELLKY